MDDLIGKDLHLHVSSLTHKFPQHLSSSFFFGWSFQIHVLPTPRKHKEQTYLLATAIKVVQKKNACVMTEAEGQRRSSNGEK